MTNTTSSAPAVITGSIAAAVAGIFLWVKRSKQEVPNEVEIVHSQSMLV